MVPISQRDAGHVMTIFVFMDSSAHQSLQQDGGLILRGSLTELDLDLPVFILGFYLSLWETPV